MSNESTKTAPPHGRAPLIHLTRSADDLGARILKRQAPAWLISVVSHLLLLGLFVLFNLLVGDRRTPFAVGSEIHELDAKVEEEDSKPVDLNPEEGFDPKLPASFDIDRRDDLNVPGVSRPEDPIGDNRANGPKESVPPPPGLSDANAPGSRDAAIPGVGMIGEGRGMSGPPPRPGEGFPGRSGSARDQALRTRGGNPATEAGVTRGLFWLSKQQKPDGSWEIDGSHKSKIPGTGIALLPFLAAGYTHKSPPKEGNPADREKLGQRFPQQIDAGLKYLTGKQARSGDFGTENMYDHAIATMAICEAYGMTADRRLLPHAQAAVDFILRAQHSAGGWRYSPGQAGDTSVTGWQVQALKSAHLAGLKVPKETLTRAGQFLDFVAAGQPTGSTYGYNTKAGSPAMTAVGLLCRQYLGWGPRNPALIAGIDELKKLPPRDHLKPDGRDFDVYYFYYASQVVFFYGGPEWHDFWNPRMHRWLLDLQVGGTGPNAGSWNPDGTLTGANGGRLLTTSMCLLTLEIYYRHLPLYKRDAGAMKDLEGS